MTEVEAVKEVRAEISPSSPGVLLGRLESVGANVNYDPRGGTADAGSLTLREPATELRDGRRFLTTAAVEIVITN